VLGDGWLRREKASNFNEKLIFDEEFVENFSRLLNASMRKKGLLIKFPFLLLPPPEL
jgi:hypothetical protein